MGRCAIRLGVLGLVAPFVGGACSSPAPAQPSPELPCDVAAVLENVCQTCHSSPPQHGAPVPLVTYADTQAPYTQLPTYDHVPTFRVMRDVIAAGVMPQPFPNVSITDEQRKAIIDWATNGAPPRAAGASCR